MLFIIFLQHLVNYLNLVTIAFILESLVGQGNIEIGLKGFNFLIKSRNLEFYFLFKPVNVLFRVLELDGYFLLDIRDEICEMFVNDG